MLFANSATTFRNLSRYSMTVSDQNNNEVETTKKNWETKAWRNFYIWKKNHEKKKQQILFEEIMVENVKVN